MFIVVAVFLFMDKDANGYDFLTSGIVSIWYAIWLLPVSYDITIKMVDNTLTEPLQLSIIKLLLVMGIGTELALDYRKILIEQKIKKLAE